MALSGSARLLVVDDEPKMCATLKKVLEGVGYRVGVAHNGQEGWERFEQFQPECVILDLRMPGTNGYELLVRLKSVPGAPHVIVTTAMASETLMRMCEQAGAALFLIKPIRFDRLIEHIGRLLRSGPQADASMMSTSPHGNH